MKKKTLFIITTVFVLVAFIVLCRMLDTASADGGAFSEAKQSNYFSDDFADDRYLDGVAYQWTERDKNPLSVSRTINVGGTLVIENQNAAQTDNNYACTFLQAHNAASSTDYAQSWTLNISGPLLQLKL